jgi:predicted RND superfamily exporter protein
MRIDAGFARWGEFVCRHPRLAIASVAVLTGLLVSGLRMPHMEVSLESLLDRDDPVRLAYDDFRREFGSDEHVLLITRSDDLFSLDFLMRLRNLHRDIEASVPHVDSVESLINARVTRGDGNELIVEDLLEHWPETQADLDRIRQYALANPLYQNLFISSDGRHAMTTIQVSPDGGPELDAMEGFDESSAEDNSSAGRIPNAVELAEVINALQAVVDRHETEVFPIWVGGDVPYGFHLIRMVGRDMALFTGLAIAMIGAVLALLFRRTSGVVLPLASALFSLGCVMGAMSLLDLPLTPLSQIFPALLLAIGIAGPVHLLVIFYPLYDAGASRKEAISAAFRHSGFAVAMTSATTAGSLLSFLSAKLAPIYEFGIEAPLAVLLALVYSLVLIPAFLSIVEIRRRPPAHERSDPIGRALAAMGTFSTRHPWSVITLWGALIVASTLAASRLTPSYHPLQYFPPEHVFRQATELANDRFQAAMTMELLIDTGMENGLYDPGILREIDALQDFIREVDVPHVGVGKVIGLTDIIKETHQALNENNPTAHAIPESRELVAQELLLFENSGSEALTEVVDPQFRFARLQVLLTFSEAYHLKKLAQAVSKRCEALAGEVTSITLTGVMILVNNSLDALLTGMFRSYALALAAIVPLMVLLLRSLKWGLVSMIPNLAPIAVGMGLMHLLEIPLDFFVSMVGSIAIGVAVDDTIHFMHGFRRSYTESRNAEQAVQETLLSTGRALLVTSVVLTCGFFIFTLATMANVVNFGIIAGSMIVTAFLADVALSPAMVTLLTRREDLARRRLPADTALEPETREESPSSGYHAIP